MSIQTATAGLQSRLSTGSAGLVLAARVLLSVLFVVSGFGKLTTIGDTAGFFGGLGLPAPTALAILVGLLELGGGVALIVGFKTRIIAAVMALFTLAATAVAHLHFGDPMQMLMLQKNLGITGGFILLAVVGAGPLSLDGTRA